MSHELYLGDCLEVMRQIPDNTVDSVVTDPPYGIRFMGKSWDGADIEARRAQRCSISSRDKTASANGGHRSLAAEAGKYDLTAEGMLAFQEFSREWAAEALRILKPGGHLLSFSSPRTYHHMAVGIEMAGFQIRDQIMWVFGSGFPKSHNLKNEWEGWGTALKPAHEPVCVARKPFKGSVACNVEEYRTGAINIDACRIPGDPSQPGRWPANLIHDGSDEVIEAFPDAKGQQGALTGNEPSGKMGAANTYSRMDRRHEASPRVETDKSASRFFYCAKTTRKDRNEGLQDPGPQFKHGAALRKVENTETKGNNHPTVKPTELMAYLCRLVTPPGGTVLDPFMGSGSTGKAAIREGFAFIGIEREPVYMEIAEKRICHEAIKSGKTDFDDLI